MSYLMERAQACRPALSLLPSFSVSPMDLVCRRVPRRAWHRGGVARGASRHTLHDGAPFETRDEWVYQVSLPNPRHPIPAAPPIRHDGSGKFESAACWGTPGSEGADIALNVLAAYLPFRISDRLGAVRVRDGTVVSGPAIRGYRAFQAEFLVGMPPEGGVVPEATIRDWIRKSDLIDKRGHA